VVVESKNLEKKVLVSFDLTFLDVVKTIAPKNHDKYQLETKDGLLYSGRVCAAFAGQREARAYLREGLDL
jgi:hypothetical protein